MRMACTLWGLLQPRHGYLLPCVALTWCSSASTTGCAYPAAGLILVFFGFYLVVYLVVFVLLELVCLDLLC